LSDLSRTAAASLFLATVALGSIAAGAATQQFLPDIIISSTVPLNGDLNPYGVRSYRRASHPAERTHPAIF